MRRRQIYAQKSAAQRTEPTETEVKEPGLRCSVCGKEFKSKAGLSGHMRYIHGDTRRPDKPDHHGTPS